jgi:hypothetical protein
MRRQRVVSVVLGPIVAVFMALFVLQHAGLLVHSSQDADARDLDPPANAVAAGDYTAIRLPAVRPTSSPAPGRVLFAPVFGTRTRLVTNDFAYYNAGDRQSVSSPDWLVTSGSLFARSGAGWTGVPDSVKPNARSTNGTGSATFRVVTRRRDFGNVAVSFDLLVRRIGGAPHTRAHSWDGVHVFLHYRSQHSLYVLTVDRSDHVVLVKKKQPGGPANGGTYYPLDHPVPSTLPTGRWEHVLATIASRGPRLITITLSINGRQILSATDSGVGGRPLTQPGAVGIRGDNTNFEFTHFQVRALAG